MTSIALCVVHFHAVISFQTGLAFRQTESNLKDSIHEIVHSLSLMERKEVRGKIRICRLNSGPQSLSPQTTLIRETFTSTLTHEAPPPQDQLTSPLSVAAYVFVQHLESICPPEKYEVVSASVKQTRGKDGVETVKKGQVG
jgi:hypothetical protein